MDFLLMILAIGGLVFALVMLVLASRARQLERESDARVQRLEALSVGSVLFASDELVEWADEGVESPDEAAVREAPKSAPLVTFDMTADTYPFVMTVPAGAGRVPGSFDRTQRRSRT